MKRYIDYDIYHKQEYILCHCGAETCWHGIEPHSPYNEQRLTIRTDISDPMLDDSIVFHLPQNFKLVEVQEVEPLTSPDGPGWWAFEGTVDKCYDSTLKELVEINYDEDCNCFVFELFGSIYPVEWAKGKWWKVKTPWKDRP